MFETDDVKLTQRHSWDKIHRFFTLPDVDEFLVCVCIYQENIENYSRNWEQIKHLHDPRIKGHDCLSMGKFRSSIGQDALIVSLKISENHFVIKNIFHYNCPLFVGMTLLDEKLLILINGTTFSNVLLIFFLFSVDKINY